MLALIILGVGLLIVAMGWAGAATAENPDAAIIAVRTMKAGTVIAVLAFAVWLI